jgi:putative tributyrin esterase
MQENGMSYISCDYYSVARKASISFSVILPIDPPPTGMEPGKYVSGPFPTIYLLHGYSGNRNTWLFNNEVNKWASNFGYAVIMPDGTNNFYLDNDDTGALYGEFIGVELIDITRRMFPLSHKREDTIIAGISMGGFGSIRNGLKYADTFGAIIGHSSALITEEVSVMEPGTGNDIAPYGYYRHTFGDLRKLLGSDKDPRFLAKAILQSGHSQPRLFIACGSEDFLFKQNSDFHEYLVNIGYPHEWWVKPGVHNFDFWDQSLQASMNWLVQKV